jgi:anti-sigma B factor antagonist
VGTVKISFRRMDKITILDLVGNIDLSTSPELRKALLHELKDTRTPRVILNLLQVKYIDSSGIASLVEGLKASRDVGSRFILFGLSQSAREVMQLSKLNKIFEIYDLEEQALSS